MEFIIRIFRSTPFSVQFLFLSLLLSSMGPGTALAAASPDNFWQEIRQDQVAVSGERRIVPDQFRTFELAVGALEAALAVAPPERSVSGGVRIHLPMPDGTFQEFIVQNSPIMEAELAQRYPDISTYVAVSADDSATTARLDMTPAGFHAIIFSTKGTIYIDPYQTNSRLEYISYYKRDLSNKQVALNCGVTGQRVATSHNERENAAAKTPVGNTLRTYRLAVAATGEYTTFHGGTVEAGQAAIVTVINRVNGIYERELSIRLSLIADNDLLVYTDSTNDPYSNSDGEALLSENQANVDSIIGSANYDVGHVFSTDGGGLASLGVVCTASTKAQGETGLASPVGDPFAVDYVAHELGHQFGGNHTFNGSTGSCSGGTRNSATAYEPGSGSTIQAYAGICGAENLQANSDDYFHTISFDQITTYVTGSGDCSADSATGNTIPTAPTLYSYTVPVSTPLMLSSTEGVDPDDGQTLTYTWEQFDLGAQAPPSTDDGSRPIFRSFPPKTSTQRYLPQMPDILSGSPTLGESMATTDRTLTFRLTVRDNAAGGGGVDYSSVAHEVTADAGPFTVTSQSVATDWIAGSTQTVTWDVGNTLAAPVNCSNVDIIFSDQQFSGVSDIPLLENTPNDGSQEVSAPMSASGPGRIMVRCSSNIFFDINDAPITLVGDDQIFEDGFEGKTIDPEMNECMRYEPTMVSDTVSTDWSERNETDTFTGILVTPSDPGGGFWQVTVATSEPVSPSLYIGDLSLGGAITAEGSYEQKRNSSFLAYPEQSYAIQTTDWVNAALDQYPWDYVVSYVFQSRVDCYEPNDVFEDAKWIPKDEEIEAYALAGYITNTVGAFAEQTYDWYRFQVSDPNLRIELLQSPSDIRMSMVLFKADNTTAPMDFVVTFPGGTNQTGRLFYLENVRDLEPGTYYLQVHHDFAKRVVNQDTPIPNHWNTKYRFRVESP